jgi:outer membrane protein insertion porin family
MYQKEGYVMTRVQDVLVENGVVTVLISEPKVGEIIIQGNKRTRDYVVKRYLRLKEGDLFNANKLRLSLNRLNNLGFFEDVSVGFEPNETDPEKLNLILTVVETKTGKVGFDVGYGTSSGFSGGINYSDTNWQGLGNKASIGFDVGDREQYWVSYENPYMDDKTYAWKVGAYKRQWENVNAYSDTTGGSFEYDQTKIGGYLGAGKKFKGDGGFSWFVTVDWHKVENTVNSGDVNVSSQDLYELADGTNFSVAATLARNKIDEYSPFPKGDFESINLEKGFSLLGGDWDYFKYWVEARVYYPISKLMDLFETSFASNPDNPPILAARIRAGWADGEVPWAEQYEVGGTNTLRGYDDDYFRGNEMFLGNVELRFPVEKTFSLVLFYDVGNAWDTATGEGFSFSDLHDGKGVGVRVKTPLGNLRLDMAQGDEETKTHFGFNEMF